MTGKDKCEFLREIRKNMAKANVIPYEPRECDFEGDCSGTCPFCEKEAADLLAALKEKERQGLEIKADEYSTMLMEKGKMDSEDAYEAFASEVERREEMFKPVGRIRRDEEDTELQRRQQEEMERIIREQNRPLMGDIEERHYPNEKTSPQKTAGLIAKFKNLIDKFYKPSSPALPGKISFKDLIDKDVYGLSEEKEQGKG